MSGQGQRLYFGNLDPQVTQQEVEREVHRFGPTSNVWVAKNPAGFAFVEYEHLKDAEECMRELNGVRMGDRQVKIEFAKNKGKNAAPGSTMAGTGPAVEAAPVGPKVRHRAVLKNLPVSFSWRELKDEMRRIGDVIYADVDEVGNGIVEFATLDDLEYAVRRLDGSKLDGNTINVTKETQNGAPAPPGAPRAPPPPPPPPPQMREPVVDRWAPDEPRRGYAPDYRDDYRDADRGRPPRGGGYDDYDGDRRDGYRRERERDYDRRDRRYGDYDDRRERDYRDRGRY